jgi:DNA-binding NarL/FixJ family response regulator
MRGGVGMITRSRILIVDDHAPFRSVLRELLSEEADFEIVGEAGSLGEAIHCIAIHSPHLVLTDLEMPDTHGIEAVTGLRRHYPEIKIVVISLHREEEYKYRCHKAGASGYIVKDAVHAELRSGIRTVLSGNTYTGAGAAKQAAADGATGSSVNGKARDFFAP